ncbi:MAG TPA: hypothetical protein VNA69_20375 [Thermoanaerobaculia bacterium]|nr:hypothetical protein [Thermoanaerobaculia bacterium]
MIERFNFYDVYGYLIPGAILIALLWLPHAVALGANTPTDLTAALIATIAAYVTGHILQIVANRVVPSKVEGRYPSDRLLDEDDQTFPADYKLRLKAVIQRHLRLDVSHRSNRRTAFLLCRDALIASKSTSYGEQFQGMYTLMRGVSCAAAVGCAYHVGWLWSAFIDWHPLLFPIVLFVMFAILLIQSTFHALYAQRAKLVSGWWQIRPLLFAVVCLLAVASGGVLAARRTAHAVGALSAAACVSFLACLWAFGSYREFSRTWAKTVYRAYYLLRTNPPVGAS